LLTHSGRNTRSSEPSPTTLIGNCAAVGRRVVDLGLHLYAPGTVREGASRAPSPGSRYRGPQAAGHDLSRVTGHEHSVSGRRSIARRCSRKRCELSRKVCMSTNAGPSPGWSRGVQVIRPASTGCSVPRCPLNVERLNEGRHASATPR
jgi:hypothetical protein